MWQGEVITLDWPGIELVSRLLKEIGGAWQLNKAGNQAKEATFKVRPARRARDLHWVGTNHLRHVCVINRSATACCMSWWSSWRESSPWATPGSLQTWRGS